MAEYDDDDRRNDLDRPARPRTNAAARVSAPGMLLIVFGLIGVLVEAGTLTAAFTKPTAIADAYRDFIDKQPPGPQKDDLQKQFQQIEPGLQLDSPTNIGSAAVGLIINLLMVIGGVKMRSLSGYGLAMTGAVCGIVPFSGCLCCAMPVGIWAVIVLANADVKRAFDRGRPPADYYDDPRDVR